MSKQKGLLHVCNHCGTTAFRRFLGEEATDGGYTRYDKHEDLPKGWFSYSGLGDLCPECAKQFLKIVDEFFPGSKAPIWKVREE